MEVSDWECAQAQEDATVPSERSPVCGSSLSFKASAASWSDGLEGLARVPVRLAALLPLSLTSWQE